MESQSTNQDDHSAQDEAPNPKRQNPTKISKPTER